MGRLKISSDFLPATATASGSDANHPPSDAALYTIPFRTWKGNAGGATITVTPTGTYHGIFLNNANFANVVVGSYFTGVMPSDPRIPGGRRHMFVDIPGGGSGAFTITPSTVDGGGAPELGAVAVLGVVTELQDNPGWPVKITTREAVTVTTFPSGGDEANEDGPPFLELTYTNPFWLKSSGVQATLLGLKKVPFVLWENRGKPTPNPVYAYLGRRIADVDADESLVTFSASLSLRELV